MNFLLKLLDEISDSREKMIKSTHPKDDTSFFYGYIMPWLIRVNDKGEAWCDRSKEDLFSKYSSSKNYQGGTTQIYFEYDSFSNVMRVSVSDLIRDFKDMQNYSNPPQTLFQVFKEHLYSIKEKPAGAISVIFFDFRTAQPIHISKVLKLNGGSDE